jgi:hypothetical protein
MTLVIIRQSKLRSGWHKMESFNLPEVINSDEEEEVDERKDEMKRV